MQKIPRHGRHVLAYAYGRYALKIRPERLRPIKKDVVQKTDAHIVGDGVTPEVERRRSQHDVGKAANTAA